MIQNLPSRTDVPRRAGHRRGITVTATAAVLSLTLAVDPFALGAVAPVFANGQTPLSIENREAGFEAFLSELEPNDPASIEPLEGTPPAAPESDPLVSVPEPVMPSADEQLVILTETEPSGALASTSLGSTQTTTPPPGGPVDAVVGGVNISVDEADEALAPDAVLVRTADSAETAAAGVEGILLEVTDASTSATADAEIKLTVEYETFAGIGGAEWASRLQFVWIPDCSQGSGDCGPEVLPTVNNPDAQTVTAVVPVVDTESVEPAALASTGDTVQASGTSTGGSLAVTAGPAGSQGNWGATSLSPVASWGNSGNTGSFTWSMALRAPSPAAGPSPTLGLTYSSASSDGRLPTTNNQSGPIGEGFSLATGFIERTYTSCMDDETVGANNIDRPSGDLCWGTENATMSFNGGASELIREAGTNVWHSKFDDGTKVEHLTGGINNGGERDEYWKVTTTDGTQYFFGRGFVPGSLATLNSAWTVPVFGNNPGEPCYSAQFADSRCNQVYRWNLEYVIDPVGNTMTYFYTKESNHYRFDVTGESQRSSANKTAAYTAGGHLVKVEYGTHANVSGEAPALIELTYGPRCITDKANPDSFCAGSTPTTSHHWPDTPVDLICSPSTYQKCSYAPTFYSTKRLTTITTRAFDGTAHQKVTSWSFEQTYRPQGIGDSVEYALNPMLVLNRITETSHGGNSDPADDASRPSIDFRYEFLPNRVEVPGDGQLPMVRPRINSITTETGATVTVTYLAECDATDVTELGEDENDHRTNDRLCYPVKWTPAGAADTEVDIFHKYVVNTISEAGASRISETNQELLTGSDTVETRFTYEGGAAWAKPSGALVKPDEVTYSEFRGFSAVLTTVGLEGEQSSTRTEYFRGMGDGITLTAGPPGHEVSSPDRERFQGQVLASTTYNGANTVSQVITVPGSPVVVATNAAEDEATRIPATTSYGFTFDASGALEFRTRTESTTNEYSQVDVVNDLGDVTTPDDDVCTTVDYVHDGESPAAAALATSYQVALVESTKVTATACDAATAGEAELVAWDRAEYNNTGQLLRSFRLDPEDGEGHQLISEVVAYDNRGRPTITKDALGAESTMTYTQSAGGLLQALTTTSPDPDGPFGPAEPMSTTSTFNPLLGTLISAEDASGQVTTGDYDDHGRLWRVWYPQHDGLGLPSVEYEYLVSKTGLNSVITRTLAADGASQHVSVTHYDGLLRPFQQQNEGVNSGPTRDGDAASRGQLVVEMFYDSAGRLVSQSTPQHVEGTPSATPVEIELATSQTTIEYDQAGRTIAEIFWNGTPSEAQNELWRSVTYYDGAKTLQIPPMGGTPQMAITDARGRTIELRQYLRDPDLHSSVDSAAEILSGAGRLDFQSTTYTFDPAGHMVAMAGVTTTEFDGFGQLVGVDDSTREEWTYEFDFAGRQTSASDPDGGTTETTYDAANRVLTRTNGNGLAIAYQYDTLGRTIALHDGSLTGPKRAEWQYDTALLETGQPALGALASSTRFVGSDAYVTSVDEYDLALRPLSTTFTLPETDLFEQALQSRTFTTTYSYTADGQVAEVSHPAILNGDDELVLGAELVTTQFDAASLPEWSGGGFGWGTYVAHSSFTADGRLIALDLGNTYAARVGYKYDEHSKRLTDITLEREQHLGRSLDLRYAYDDAGNVLSIKDAAASGALADNQCFGYDGLQRLTLAWTAASGDCSPQQGSITAAAVGSISPYWSEYSYDPLGNRTQLIEHGLGAEPTVTTTYQHGAGNAGPHQLTSMLESVAGGASTSTQFTYDAAGNRVSKTADGVTQELVWDVEGELVEIDDDTSFTYDASGNRMLRQTPAGLTVYLPGGQELLITGTAAESDVSATRYYSFAGRMVAMRTSGGMASVTSFVADHQGSLIAAVPNTNWAANAVERLYTDPFGGARAGSDDLPGDRGFLGAVEDDTGLTLLGARYYDAQVGSFISVDPLLSPGIPAQFNAYVYSANNPVTWSDPSGLIWNGGQMFIPDVPSAGTGSVPKPPQAPSTPTGPNSNSPDSGTNHNVGQNTPTAPNVLVNSLNAMGGFFAGFGVTAWDTFWGLVAPSPAGLLWHAAINGWNWEQGLMGSYGPMAFGIIALVSDPGGSIEAELGAMGEHWATDPAAALGGAVFTAALFVVPGGMAVRAGSIPGRASTTVGSRLQTLVDDAAAQFDSPSGLLQMSARQAAAAAANPSLAPMFRGQVIDNAVRQAVSMDDGLRDLVDSPTSGPLRPDFVLRDGTGWLDITTPSQWPMHQQKYNPTFGEGVGLFTR